jgi:hypothetical protein
VVNLTEVLSLNDIFKHSFSFTIQLAKFTRSFQQLAPAVETSAIFTTPKIDHHTDSRQTPRKKKKIFSDQTTPRKLVD